MHVQPVLGEPVLMLAFEGWNDACESASSAVRFVDTRLRGVPLAEIEPDDYYDFTVRRPQVQYDAGVSGAIAWPGTEFRYGVTEEGIELIKEMPQTEGSLWLEGNNGFEACATQGLRRMMGPSTSDASGGE